MFRKIKSNVEPGTNFFAELKKEFGGQFGNVSLNFRSFCENHPKKVFGGMVLIILVSAILSFAVLMPMERKRLEEDTKRSELALTEKNKEAMNNTAPGNNIDDVIDATSKLKNGFKMKQQVDAILSKPKLTAQDSVVLNKLLDSLHKTNRELNLKDKR